MRHFALSALSLLPLAACFEVVIPEAPTPAPADLDNGEWLFEIEQVRESGDCYGFMPDDIDDMPAYLAWAWVETHGEAGVSIDLEGMFLEGEIEGDALSASGSLSLYGDYDEGYPDEPTHSDPYPGEDDGDEDHSDEGRGEGGAPVVCEGGGAAGAKCMEEEERIDAFLTGDILASDHMRGEIVVDYVYFDTYCSIEFEFEARAQDDTCDCDCDCGCGDDEEPPRPMSGETEPAPAD
jgi:hypothetical protein